MNEVVKMREKGATTCCRALAVTAVLFCSAVSAFADTYAYKVQYLQSSGVQHIDTGVVPDRNTMFRGSYEYLGTAGAKANYDMIAACTSPRYYPVSLNSASDTHARRERYVSYNDTPNQLHPYLTRHTIVFNDALHRVFVDNEYMGTFTTGFSGASHTCYLFASNNNNNKAAYHSKARIYWCEFTDTATGTVLRRFIPVVDENGKPAMFDEINEKLYYNLGTGADFIAGPRKDEPWYFVDYIESTGTQWIDTEVRALAETRTDVGYRYANVKQNSLAMIGGVQTPSRYYPISLQGTDAKAERYDRGGGTGSEFKLTHPVVTDHEVIFNDSKRTVNVDGVEIATFTSPFEDSVKSMYMFAAHNVGANKADWLAKARIYHYDTYHTNGTLCAAFRPAVNASGKGCMYNGYTGKIHENGGTGDFALGRIVSPKVVLDLSARSDLAEGLKVMSFTVRPSWGTVFELDAATAATYDAEVRSDGVYLAAKNAAAASVVTVTGDTAANFAVGAMPTCSSIVLSGTVRLTANCDWRGLGKIVIPDGVTIDLNGHTLYTVGFMTLPETFATITDTSAAGSGGELHVEVAANELFMNDSVPLMGSLRLVKDGAGLYLAELGKQQYTGGTEIVGGTLRMKDTMKTLGAFNNQVPAKSEVLIGANGTFDANGNNWGYHIYTLDGGILTSSRRTASNSGTVKSPFTLTADSVVSNKNFGLVCEGWNEVKVRLNGHKLRYDGLVGTDNAFFIAHTTFEDEGTLVIGSGWICTTNNTYSNIGRNLSLIQPSAYSGGLWLEAPFTVSNCVMRGADSLRGNAQLTVLGTFSPLVNSTNNFPNTSLADGSTLDLSGCTGKAFNIVSKHGRRVTFPGNGTVALDLSQRNDLSDGLLVVAWDTIPLTTTFVLDDVTAVNWRAIAGAEGVTLVAKGPRDIEFAEWTGAAGNGPATDPGNWTCYDFDGLEVEGAVPNATTTIRVTGTTTLPYPTGVAWGRLMLVGNVTLGANCDWREFGIVEIPAGVTVNLNGHTLKLSSFRGDGTVNGASGELHIDVAEGKTVTNSSVILDGGITLVKDGAGTFVATKQQQTYTGGTTIAAGVLKAGAYGKYYPLGAQDSTVTVAVGATFDVNGQYDYHHYHFILAGGTIANHGGDMGTSAATREYGSIGDVTLTDDSYVLASKCTLMRGGTINLGGHTLTVTVATGKQLYMNGMTVSNGTFRTVRDGDDNNWLHLYGGCDFKDTTLELGTAVALYQTVPVEFLVNSYGGLYASGPGSFHVSGTFTPVSNAFHNVTLLDGATLDLTGHTGTWSNRSTVNHIGTHFLSVAKDAHVNVDISGRTDLRNGDRVIEWEAAPELVHRWSFNGTYEDSVGGATAEPTGAATLGAKTVSTPGTPTAAGHVMLGSYLIPTNQGPVTVELWAQVNSHVNWGKLFACGNANASNSLLLYEQANATDHFAGYLAYGGKTSGDTAWSTFGTPRFGTMEHFAVVISDVSPETGWYGTVWTRRTLDGSYVGGGLPNVAGWSPDKLDQTYTSIGGAWWNNSDAAATFDEVRIWKGALTAADLEANAAASCDTVLKSFRETAKFKFLQNGELLGAKSLADGLYLDRRGFILIVR